MVDFRGTQQELTYIWQSRKPLRLPGGHLLQRGEPLKPTVEMIEAFRDRMVPVGESLRVPEPALVVAEPESTGNASRSAGRPRREGGPE